MKENQNTLKVLMTTETVGGVWQYSLHLAQALKPLNIEIHLATMGPLPDKQQRKEAEAIPNLELYESSYKLEWQEQPWQEVEQASMWLLHLEQEIKPHLVHLNHYAFGELPWDSPVLVVGHSCLLSWWEAVKQTPVPDDWQNYRKRITRGLQAADCVVSVSHGMMQKLEKFYGPFKRSEVIYNGIPIRRNWEKDKVKRVFAKGSFGDEGKNIKALTEIAERLPYPLTIAGAESENTAKKHINLQLLDQLSSKEIDQWLDKSLFFVSTSLYEPFGLAALEAAERGCVLLLSDIETYHEIWQDNALYFDPKNPESLLKVVNQLAGNNSLISQMQDKARTRAAAFNIKNTAKVYYQLYHNLLNPLEKQDLNEQTYAN